MTVHPYAYPEDPHRRVHGPAGYSDYARYRPWLEDEFSFRCVYCLKRMVWAPTDVWVVDHLVSRAESPELECEYDNLVFACQFCNSQKGANRVPDPCRNAYGHCVRVEEDGTIRALNAMGRRLIKVLSLNSRIRVRERLNTIEIVRSFAKHNRAQFERYLGYPLDMPDLRNLKPPENRRRKGVENCHLARKERGELPAIY